MVKLGDRTFEVDRPRFQAYCAHIADIASETGRVDVGRVVDEQLGFFDQCVQGQAGWDWMAAAFPGLEPRAARAALTLRRWWPTPNEQVPILHGPGLITFMHDWAALFAQATVHQEELTEVYGAVLDLQRAARIREMPWKVLEPTKRNPWPSVSVGYVKDQQGHGDGKRLSVVVPERISPDEILGIPAEMKKVTAALAAIRTAQAAVGEMILAENEIIRDRAADVIVHVNEAREEMESMHEDLVAWNASRPAKAPHHHELYATIATDLVYAIHRATQRRPGRRPGSTTPPGDWFARSRRAVADQQAGGLYGKMNLVVTARLMKALYGLEVPVSALKSKIQDRDMKLLSSNPPKDQN